jgi:hypothetical protein
LTGLHLNLIVSGWQQSISVESRHLKAFARIEKHKLILSDETPLEKLHVDFSVLEASNMRRQWPNLKDEIGTFNYCPFQPSRDDIPEMEAFIHGFVGLNALMHQDVWEQVLTGGHSESIIQIEVGPVEFEWKNCDGMLRKTPLCSSPMFLFSSSETAVFTPRQLKNNSAIGFDNRYRAGGLSSARRWGRCGGGCNRASSRSLQIQQMCGLSTQ